MMQNFFRQFKRFDLGQNKVSWRTQNQKMGMLPPQLGAANVLRIRCGHFGNILGLREDADWLRLRTDTITQTRTGCGQGCGLVVDWSWLWTSCWTFASIGSDAARPLRGR